MRLGLGLLLGLLLFAVSCGDDKPPVVNPDKGTPDAPQVADLPPPGPEAQVPDKFVWPDFPPKDTWPQPQDSYVGSSFGCQSDGDCFGQKCCPTPWGVKLCAPTCNAK
jgi:hypothetical protein